MEKAIANLAAKIWAESQKMDRQTTERERESPLKNFLRNIGYSPGASPIDDINMNMQKNVSQKVWLNRHFPHLHTSMH